MASTKSSAKSSSVKPLASPSKAAPAKVKQTSKVKPVTKPEPIAKGKAKAAPKAAAKVGKAKAVGARAKKSSGIPLEQRRHYVEMAAYYIAERRGFAPGNPLEDWVQAEAEIDRLLAEGRLGG